MDSDTHKSQLIISRLQATNPYIAIIIIITIVEGEAS